MSSPPPAPRRGWPPPTRGAALGLLLLALALGACAGGARPGPAPAGGGEPLPVDPALVVGRLDNGLAYIVRRHQNPPGRLAIWLHVASGSLNETDETRGLAHYLEHMAFNGSANFPPGSLIPFFQSLGLSFGRDQNAFTGLDQTVYVLALPDTGPATLDRGLLYLSDVAFRMSLLPEEIDRERQIILEEKRARASPQQRVRDQVLERLAPESTLGRRLPIGTEETIRSVGPEDFQAYYRRWYVPANMTLIAVGDEDPAVVVREVARHFGSAPAAPRPAPSPAGVKRTAGTRAIVVTDPELTQADVSLTRIAPPPPPITTVEGYRGYLVEAMGTWIVNRRLEAELAEGRAAYLKGEVSAWEWGRAARFVTARATAPPDRWQPALRDLVLAVARARLYGVTEDELAEARAAFIAHEEEAAQQQSTLPARQLLRQLNWAVGRGDTPMAASQRLALKRRLLPGISAAEVSAAFAEDFAPGDVVVSLTGPPGPAVPAEAELVRIGRAALEARPEPLAERARPTSLLAAPPAGGTVVAAGEHAASGVWSAWLDNGVRVHHRRVDQPRNEASITITLAGGVIQEQAATRGVTEAAVSAWDRPATSRLSSTDIRTLMTGKKVRVRAGAGPDTLTLRVSGDPAALATGLELAYLLLTDPVVEAAGFLQWQERRVQEIAERALQPRGALAEAEAEAFFPAGEARLRLLTAEQVRALTKEAVQRWLSDLVARAPMEVAVVGDIDRDQASELVARYLGALPARERIGDKTLADRRQVPRPPGPIRATRTVTTRTDQAIVLDGFFGADVTNIDHSRRLGLAARVLSTRMNRAIREEAQLVYSIAAVSRPGEAYPGFGLFAAQAPTEPAKAGRLGEALGEMFTAFAAEGPTAEELRVAKQQILNFLDEAMKGPDFWSDRLSTLDYRGVPLDALARIVDDYRRFTAEEVRTAFAEYYRPEGRFRIVVLPEPPR